MGTISTPSRCCIHSHKFNMPLYRKCSRIQKKLTLMFEVNIIKKQKKKSNYFYITLSFWWQSIIYVIAATIIIKWTQSLRRLVKGQIYWLATFSKAIYTMKRRGRLFAFFCIIYEIRNTTCRYIRILFSVQ